MGRHKRIRTLAAAPSSPPSVPRGDPSSQTAKGFVCFVWSGWVGLWRRALARECLRREGRAKAGAVVGNCMRGVERGRIESGLSPSGPRSSVVVPGAIVWSWRGRRCSGVSGVSEGPRVVYEVPLSGRYVGWVREVM